MADVCSATSHMPHTLCLYRPMSSIRSCSKAIFSLCVQHIHRQNMPATCFHVFFHASHSVILWHPKDFGGISLNVVCNSWQTYGRLYGPVGLWKCPPSCQGLSFFPHGIPLSDFLTFHSVQITLTWSKQRFQMFLVMSSCSVWILVYE